MNTKELEAEIASALRDGQSLTGKDGILTPLIQRAVCAALEGEMAVHLDDAVSNRRNGYNRKQVKSGSGRVVMTFLPRTTPCKAMVFISLSTVHRATSQP